VGIAIAVTSSVWLNPPESVQQKFKTILPASIRPHTLATLNSKFPGRVVAVHVTSGVKVNPGDLLLTILNPDFELEYERAKVHLANVQKRLVLHGTAKNTESQAQSASRALQAAKERLANVSPDDTQKAYENAAANVRELERLAQQQLATEREVEEARKIEETELRNLRAEREHVSRLKEEVEAAKTRFEESREDQAPSSSEAATLEAELREAQEELRIATEHRDSQNILATVSGTVLRTIVNVGDEIPSGVPLLQVAQFDQLDFDVPVGADLARNIKVGQKVKLRIPTEPPTRIAAAVSAILLVPAQEQSAYTVRITTPNPSPSTVLVGLTGEVEFPHTEAAWRQFRF
jgi:membrane fusion protein (multidrug efflux system)